MEGWNAMRCIRASSNLASSRCALINAPRTTFQSRVFVQPTAKRICLSSPQIRHYVSERDGQPQAKASKPPRDIDSLLKETLDGNKGTPAAPVHRRSRYSSRNAQKEERGEDAILAKVDKGQSKEDALNDILGQLASGVRKPNSADTVESIIGSHLDPLGNSQYKNKLPPLLPVKLSPSLGTSVRVTQDIGKSFRELEILMKRNQVRSDFQRQKFHERPGLKRKRLASERWRRTFKEGFKGMVSLVKRMRKQGW